MSNRYHTSDILYGSSYCVLVFLIGLYLADPTPTTIMDPWCKVFAFLELSAIVLATLGYWKHP